MEALINQNQVTQISPLPNLRFSVYLNRMLSILGHTLVVCLECLAGLHVGGFAGWAIGWCIGLICQNYTEPMHSTSLDLITRWHYLPYEYSRYGLTAGAILGTSVVLMITVNKLTKPIETKGESKTELK